MMTMDGGVVVFALASYTCKAVDYSSCAPPLLLKPQTQQDALRDGPINDLVDACHHMVLTHCVTSPHVAADVLDALQRYINWMDVGLLVNDTWLPLLFDCVQQGGAASELRGAAVDVVGEIVSKRMEAVQKLQLVQQLPMVGVFARGWVCIHGGGGG